MRGIAVCAGVGGLELALGLALPNYRTVVYVEREIFAAATLVARMAQGILDEAPVWDDVRTFDARPWRGRVEILSAGFPCQPWSAAGHKRGHTDDRWLWPDIARAIEQLGEQLRVVFLENVPGLIGTDPYATVCLHCRISSERRALAVLDGIGLCPSCGKSLDGRPAFVVEWSGLAAVLAALDQLGFDAEWGTV